MPKAKKTTKKPKFRIEGSGLKSNTPKQQFSTKGILSGIPSGGGQVVILPNPKKRPIKRKKVM